MTTLSETPTPPYTPAMFAGKKHIPVIVMEYTWNLIMAVSDPAADPEPAMERLLAYALGAHTTPEHSRAVASALRNAADRLDAGGQLVDKEPP